MSYLTRSRIIAVSASVAVIAGLAGTGSPSASAAPAAERGHGTPGVEVTRKDLSKEAKEAGNTRPRILGAKAAGGEPGDALPAGVPAKGRYAFLIELSSKSTGAAYAAAAPKGKPAAQSAAKGQLGTVTTAQNRVIDRLPDKSKVLYRSHAVMAGLAVVTDVKNYRALTRISGVKAVYPIAPKSPSNSYAVPLQHAPQAWEAHSNLGADSSIAIIDTGVDYTHANFGGVGTVADYDDAKAELGQPVSEGEFPGPKVIGGYDLAGDDYDADPTSGDYDPVPAPDPWPLDCNGHGSHVAGSAAGYGVTSAGETYAGAYNTSTPFGDLRIGPGVAPHAKLYAFRVFGCDGSTDLVSAAIDRAADPNGDGDISDHVDVVNMSLGSDFGSPQDGDSVMTEAASKLKGMTMVVASGNAGDLYDTGGSPGNAPSALTVAASQDAYAQLDALQVSGPPAIDGDYASERSIAYAWGDDPDLSGTVVQLTQPGNDDGCLPVTEPYASQIDGHIAFVEWTDNDSARRCGSAARAANLVAAGATGFIYADDQETFSAGITGSAVIPGVLVAKSGGDAIRTQLEADNTVTISGTEANGFSQFVPGNDDTVAGFSSRGIGDAGNVKPDVTAVGNTVFSTGVGTGNQGLTESGTSMATPMVAGAAALVNTAHPNWTPEQVKADIMNTAGADLYTGQNQTGDTYAPQRVGTGRMQVDNALDNEVLAYVAEDPGAVSVSFGPQAVTEAKSLTKHITVQNTSLSEKEYDVSYDARSTVPGATYEVAPSHVTIDPESSTTVTVTLHLDPSEMTKTIDPTVDPLQGGLPRQFQADASGLVVLDSVGNPQLRVPVYAAPRPASEMTQGSTLTLPSGAVQEALLPLTGQAVNQGGGPTKVQSTVAGFELQATSGQVPECSAEVTHGCVSFPDERAADIKYVGATSSAPQLAANGDDPADATAYFSITTHGRWRTPASAQEFDITLDGNADGTPDAVLFNTRLPESDVIVSELYDFAEGDITWVDVVNDSLGDTDTAIFDSDTIVLQVPAFAIPGWSPAASRINYAVDSYSPYQSDPVDSIGGSQWLSFDPLHPGVALYGSYTGEQSPLMFPDSPSSVLNLRRDAASYAADHGLGALVVHFHNELGQKAQVVGLKNTPTVGLALAPNPAQRGQQVTATITVPESAGTAATGPVTLKQGATTLASGTVTDGTAQLKFAIKKAGTFPVVAEYAGDDTHNPGVSAPVNVQIVKTRPTITMTLSTRTLRPGQRDRAIVRVTTVAGIPATGRIVVRRANGLVLARGTLSNGVVRLLWTNTSRRSFLVRAMYSGDANYLSGASPYQRVRVITGR